MHRQTGQLFALKNLEHERFPTHQFLRELRFLLSLQHPNIVTCQTIEHTQTGRYLVMDYCEGGTLRSLMGDEVALPLAQCIQIVTDVLCGLASAHQQGIIHCDIKPENILLTLNAKGWMAKISDFGIARLNQEVYSQSTGNTGSPAYMAPERFYSQYSAASDIYAVGVLLFELLVGHRPFTGTPKALMEAHLNQAVVCPEDMPAGLQGVINTALQKLPARRFQSAMEMLDAIASVVAKMNGVLETARSIESPLLRLRQEIPYYDSDPQMKEVSKYAVNALDGLFGPPLRSNHQQIGASYLGPSHLGYTSSIYFAYCAIAPIHNTNNDDSDRNSNSNSNANKTFPLKEHSRGWRSLRLSAPIQQLLSAPQGYFLITCSTIYWVDPVVLAPSHTANIAPPSASPAPLTAQPIYELDQDCIAAIEPGGHWIALVTDFRKVQPKQGRFSTLSFHPLPRRSVSMALPQCSMRLRVAGQAKRLLKAIALDIRHVAIISDGPHPKSPPPQSQQIIAEDDSEPSSERTNPRPPLPKTMDRGTYIEVFTRRGQRIALQYLPMCLGTVITTPKPYRLLATDQYDPTSILCIDLKPFRIQRFALDIKPQFLAATDWGYIAADVQGSIVFLDMSGDAVSALHGPSNLTSITFLAPQFLFLSTWKEGDGFLYTLDLQQQMTHWLF